MENSLSQFFTKVYGWTFLALIVSGAVALWVASMPNIQIKLYTNPWIMFGLIMVQLLLVIWLVARIDVLSTGMANGFYFLYAALNGAMLSTIFITYEIGTIYAAFFTAAGMFIVMSIFGMVTKVDLSKMGMMLLMALFGIIIAIFINIFLQSKQFDFVISIITVIVFTLLTAHDTQKLKTYYARSSGDRESMSKMALMGALALYLDFINMFLALLRIFGRR